MRKTFLLIATIFWILTLAACDEPPPQPTQKPAKPAAAPAKAKSAPPPKPASQPWPFLAAGSQESDVADDLLAKNYLLIFDGSGSMNETDCGNGRAKIKVAREAVAQWIKSLPSDANLGLVSFNYQGWARLPLAVGNRQDVIDTVLAIAAGGKTPLTQAFDAAFTELTRQGRRQLGYGDYTIVVVTDGIANNRTTLARMVQKILAVSPVTVYTIGFCIGTQHSLNQPGQTIYKPANNPEELRQGLQEVLAEAEVFDDAGFDQ